MNDKEKIELMAATIKPIVDLIQTRLDSRLDLLQTLAIQPLDSVPESIKNKREDECAKIRAVVQEQRDLLATIKALFPITDAQAIVSKKPAIKITKKVIKKDA
jgi:hypothetical protein